MNKLDTFYAWLDDRSTTWGIIRWWGAATILFLCIVLGFIYK